MTSVAALATPVAATAAAFVGVTGAAKAFSSFIEGQVNQFADVSMVLSRVQAESQLRAEISRIGSARRLAPDLATFERERSRATIALNANVTEFKKAGLEIAEEMLPLIRLGVDGIELITKLLEFVNDNEVASKGILAQILTDAAGITTISRLLRKFFDEEDEEFIGDDPMMEELLSDLVRFGVEKPPKKKVPRRSP